MILHRLFSNKHITLEKVSRKIRQKKKESLRNHDIFSNVISLLLVSKSFATRADVINSILSRSKIFVTSVDELIRLEKTFSEDERRKITSFNFHTKFQGSTDMPSCSYIMRRVKMMYPRIEQIYLPQPPWGTLKQFRLETKNAATLFALVANCQNSLIRWKRIRSCKPRYI